MERARTQKQALPEVCPACSPQQCKRKVRLTVTTRRTLNLRVASLSASLRGSDKPAPSPSPQPPAVCVCVCGCWVRAGAVRLRRGVPPHPRLRHLPAAPEPHEHPARAGSRRPARGGRGSARPVAPARGLPAVGAPAAPARHLRAGAWAARCGSTCCPGSTPSCWCVGCPLWEHLLPRLDTFVLVRGLPAVGAPAAPARHLRAGAAPPYCDPKVANREIRVGHLVIENGY
jgi:hypothetical protein